MLSLINDDVVGLIDMAYRISLGEKSVVHANISCAGRVSRFSRGTIALPSVTSAWTAVLAAPFLQTAIDGAQLDVISVRRHACIDCIANEQIQ